MKVEAELYFRGQPDGEGQVHRELVVDGISQVGRQECNIERQLVGELIRVDQASVAYDRFCGHCVATPGLTPVEEPPTGVTEPVEGGEA